MMLPVVVQMLIIQMICQILMVMIQIDQVDRVDHHILIIHIPGAVATVAVAMVVAAVAIQMVPEMADIIIKLDQMLQINKEETKAIPTVKLSKKLADKSAKILIEKNHHLILIKTKIQYLPLAINQY